MKTHSPSTLPSTNTDTPHDLYCTVYRRRPNGFQDTQSNDAMPAVFHHGICSRPKTSKIIPHDFRSHHAAFVVTRRLAGVLRLFNLGDHKLKGLGDVVVQPGAGLGEGALKIFCQLSSLFGCDLSLLRLQVALVADNDQRDPVRAL